MSRGKVTTVALAIIVFAVGWFVYRHTEVFRIDDEVTLVRTPDPEVLVVVGPRGEIRVTRVKREPPPVKLPPTPAQKGPKPPQQPAQKSPTVWTLPYSCSDVKDYSRRFTKTQLNAMRVKAGIREPTDAELHQIEECKAGKIK